MLFHEQEKRAWKEQKELDEINKTGLVIYGLIFLGLFVFGLFTLKAIGCTSPCLI